MFDNPELERYLYDHFSMATLEMDRMRRHLSDARNITVSVPSYSNEEANREAIESTVQEVLFPLLTNGRLAVVPRSCVIGFSGTLWEARQLRGYGICDGQVQNGMVKPDLRHKFVRGAGPDENAGDTGGSDCTLIVIGEHTAGIKECTSGCLVCAGAIAVAPCPHGHDFTDDTDFTHDPTQSDNKPPFYELIWIIKL
jgi:hypothetical protein